jgi:hypothetical protein
MTAVVLLDRILEQLGDVRARCPELRFGQLIAIVGELAQDQTGHSLWDVEDADFAAALQRFSADMVHGTGSLAAPTTSPEFGGVKSSGSPAPEPPRQVN